MNRGVRAATAACAALVIFAPASALVFTGAGTPNENRTPVAFTGLDSGWHSIGAFGDFVADRIPLRSRAVRTDAWVDEQVFDEDPAFGGAASSRVIKGSDGFLFLADAIDNACAPAVPPENSAAHLSDLAGIIQESGRDVLMMVAPDKSSVHPELMDEFAKQQCFGEYTESLWQHLDDAEIAGFVNLRRLLRDASASTREPLYLRKDSHWDSAGSLVAIEAGIEHFQPGLWSDEEVNYRGLGEYTGDLTGLQGKPEVDEAPLYEVLRPDVVNQSTEVLDDIEGGFNRRFINSAPAGRLIEGRTVMFVDSFGMVSLPQYVPFFEDLTVIRLVDFEAQRFADVIEDADRVWVMSVERSLSYRLENEVGATAFLDLLRAQLLGST